VTSVVRQGVSYEIAAGSFPGGATGIREVDTWIARYNPSHLLMQPAVWTPDEPVLVRTITIPPAAAPPTAPPTYAVTLPDGGYFDDGWVPMRQLTYLLVSQVTPTPGVATDAEIASVDFGDGTPVVTAPYPRYPVTQGISHTFQDFGEYTYTVTYTDPAASPSIGLVKVTTSYSIDEKPRDWEVTAGVEPYQVAPWDAWDSPPILPPNEHFATIDWGDGITETNPFVVDSEGYVPHIYAAPGTYNPRMTTISGYPLSGGVNVVPNLTPVYSVTEMTEYPVVDFTDSAGLLIEQVTPTPGEATDAEIASITWEPGVVQSPPFVRDVLGRILHTYTSFGDKTWRVDFTAPGATPVTGSVHVTYYYYIGWMPVNGIIDTGGTIAVRPLDNWQGNPLPPDEHFKAIDWRDGSPIQHPPFTVDGNGFATHVYTTAGVYNIQIGFIDNFTTSLGITVNQAPPTYLVTEKAPNPSNPPVPWLPVGVLKVEQVTPTPGPAADAEIASITWGDGTAPQVAPYTQVQGYIRHTYEVHGTVHPDGSVDELPWTVDFTDPGSPNATGTYPVLIDYYMTANPSNWAILVGGTFGIKPIDGYQGPVLPPDSHYATIDWKDGSPVQSPPYTVDGGGFATHVYNATGTFVLEIAYFNGQMTSGGLNVTATVVGTQEELDAYNATYDPSVHEKPPREGAES
jgi:hypothetical protein